MNNFQSKSQLSHIESKIKAFQHCIPIWNPAALRYVAYSIESFQKGATKLVYQFDEDLLRGLDLPFKVVQKGEHITAFKICQFYPYPKRIFSFQSQEGLLEIVLLPGEKQKFTSKFLLPNRLLATWNGLPPHLARILL